MLAQCVDQLRQRFFLAKKLRSLRDIAEETGLNRQTLASFARGGTVTTATLVAIEAWIDQQDAGVTVTP